MQVRFEKVTKRFGKTVAVRDLNLTIKDGALHFILGPSGCGKTTLLRMLAGLEAPSEGRIFFGDRDVTHLEAAERNIGMVFQNYALWPHMSVKQNITYGLRLRKLTREDLAKRLSEVLDFTQLTNFAERLPNQLSGGQQQRVALARALAIRPSVLLLDEPLSNLDAKLRLEMRDNIARIHRQTGITTVYVTHDQKEALSMGTEISIMHGGVLIQSGGPRQLYRHPATPFIAGFIGETNLLAGKILSSEGSHGVVDTALGKFRARCDFADLKTPGQAVMLSFRPESIKLLAEPLAEDSKLENIFTTKLNHGTYLGEVEQLNLIADQVAVKANIFNVGEKPLPDGQQLKVGVAMNDVCILPVEKDLGPGT